MYHKTIKIGTRQVPVRVILVTVQDNEQDWEFVFNDVGDGKKVMAVF